MNAPQDRPATSTSVDHDPEWLEHGLTQLWDELCLYFRTVVAFTLRPGRTVAEWVGGRHWAMSPLAYFGTSIAVVGTSTKLLAYLHPAAQTAPPSLGVEILHALAPYLQWVSVALFCHVVLRLGGTLRKTQSTLAVALFAAGGPAAAATVLKAAFGLFAERYVESHHLFGSNPAANGLPGSWSFALALLSGGLFLIAVQVAFFLTLAIGLAQLHRLKWRWILLGVGAGMVGSHVVLTITGLKRLMDSEPLATSAGHVMIQMGRAFMQR